MNTAWGAGINACFEKWERGYKRNQNELVYRARLSFIHCCLGLWVSSLSVKCRLPAAVKFTLHSKHKKKKNLSRAASFSLPFTHPTHARRALLRCDAGSGASTIPLDNVKESIWWAEFTGHDLERIKIKRLRKAVHLQELLFILGADHDNDGDDDSDDDGNDDDDDDDDDDDSVFSLAPGLCGMHRFRAANPDFHVCLSFPHVLQTISASSCSSPPLTPCRRPST